jgi:hypothetical protein
VALIVAATLLARGAEWLAGARACPNRSVIGDAGESQGIAPSADAGEEVALGESAQIVRLDLDNGSLVNVTGRDLSGSDKFSQPLGGIGVDLVVVRTHIAHGEASRQLLLVTTFRTVS